MHRNKIKYLIYCKLSEYRKPLIVLGAKEFELAIQWLLAAMAKLSLQTAVEGNSILEEFKGSQTKNYVMRQLPLKEDNDIFYWTNLQRNN